MADKNTKNTKNTKKKGALAAPATAAQKITKRVVDVKRHTKGYVDSNGKFMSVRRARQLASWGKISGVRVVGNHIQAATGRKPLSSLPTTVDTKNR